ncbi:helix-turn-helix domain-containing protein [Ancylobacter defluvii]|uniref:Ner winged helix-turn-helix DNA-binding domain-containing protein n=1 Tax=Ancylobacter defluvii TaxID=1282440 RepID=A0A9W6JYY4_9HYPH|nr:helix-turn-helix domain-containing protein [Ancylobacter defluvii]MBS7586446.1 helix-turn-helix domain-containing protein [Ancylobacter defluvii]GLK85727.1 hypothetical protein GCM10017653_37970 [Ancylobacter defluvii]
MRKVSADLSQDWHAEQVKAAVRMRGAKLSQLGIAHGYEASTIYKVWTRPWPELERIIATFLELKPQDIWPSRYDRAGRPKRQRSNGKRMVNDRLRQKSKAA